MPMQPNIFTRDSVWVSWLHKRGITDTVISKFNLSETSHGSLLNCLKIPVECDAPFNKYRRNPTDDQKPKYIYDTGTIAALYGKKQCEEVTAKNVLITEGELDALVAWSANIPAVSSTGGAMTFKQEWVEWLTDKSVTICFDNDEAGGKGMAKVVYAVPRAKVLFLPDRPGVKDISDYVGSGGDLHALLRTTKHFTSEEDVRADMSERRALWKSTHFHEAFVALLEEERERRKREEKRVHAKTYDKAPDVEKAKAYPIEDLLELRFKKCKCLWHNEESPSLHLFSNNKMWCFGSCGKGYDAIDVYMKKNEVDFKTAVKDLCNM